MQCHSLSPKPLFPQSPLLDLTNGSFPHDESQIFEVLPKNMSKSDTYKLLYPLTVKLNLFFPKHLVITLLANSGGGPTH